MVEALQVGTPVIDVFAQPSNARCPKFWSKSDSAFEHSWKAQGLLWMNPPFSKFEEVVNKIEAEGPECLLLVPNWPSAPWFKKVQDLSAKAHFFPAGSRLFETDEGKAGPTRWGTWVFYIPSPETAFISILTIKNPGERSLFLSVCAQKDGQEIGPPPSMLWSTLVPK